MNILFISSEASPFSKTGGLAEVSASLPTALSQLGHNVYLVIPAHRSSFYCGYPIAETGVTVEVALGNKVVRGSVLESRLPNTEVIVYLIRHDGYFDREGIYSLHGEEYTDNSERFIFFSRAALELVELLNLPVDVVHTNDWQTGLVPAYLKTIYNRLRRYEQVVSLHTIHNLAFQGVFWHWDILLTGIDWEHFTFDKMEFYGKLNFLKTGIAFADGVSTVSPRYAQEIQTPQYGCSLEDLLKYRKDNLRGILNGIDTTLWNPATDGDIPVKYSSETVFQHKPACKAALQKEMKLPAGDPSLPLFGYVGRLAFQKGTDLIADAIPDWVEQHGFQFCILGTGDPATEMKLQELAKRYPENVAVTLSFETELAHRIQAGSDMLLMPSRYEPCGLSQLFAQMYGTVPIVRETGGLVDTVVNVTDTTLADGTATGFTFYGDDVHAMNETIWRAVSMYRDRKIDWENIVRRGMTVDWSWKRSAEEYVRFYQELR